MATDPHHTFCMADNATDTLEIGSGNRMRA